jgi:hypothetical protein
MRLTTTLRRASVVFAAPALIATVLAMPTTSVAQEDAAFRQYQCTVLGDNTACPAPYAVPATRTEVQVVPGPHALYRMHLGQDASDAIEAARASGEQPAWRTVRITTRQFTPKEAHERHLGLLSASSETQQILAEVPVEADAVRACIAAEATAN